MPLVAASEKGEAQTNLRVGVIGLQYKRLERVELPGKVS